MAKKNEGILNPSHKLVGMYDEGAVSARVYYNWRSKYLVIAIDCFVGFPIWKKSTGYLDASLRLLATANIEFVLEGTNLLGTDTVLMQQVDSDGLLKPNAWFKNDRRYQLGVRLSF